MKNNIDYTLSEKEIENKVKHWFWVFIRTLREGQIDISSYRKVEPNIDLILNDIITEIADFSWYQTREDVIKNDFILDEQAKKALEIANQTSNTSSIVEWTIQEEEKDTLENISFEELAERIWDLYYDALSFFLSELSENIDKTDIKKLIKESSKNIEKAWDLCKIPTKEFIKKAEQDIKDWKDVYFKHTDEVKWLNIDKKELAKIIWELEESKLKDFLTKLSNKMQKDWDADYYRKPKPREKLGTELHACADKLKKASELI